MTDNAIGGGGDTLNSFQVATIDAAAMDESDKMATNEIAPEALFFRRRVKGIGTRPTTVARQSFGCFEACGSSESSVEFGGVVSTVCDSTCVESYPGMGVRFNGQNCGAGDPSKYGKSCRMCYEDHDAALNADQALATSTENSWTTDDHVIMCATKRPPEAIDCPRECLDNMYTVRRLKLFLCPSYRAEQQANICVFVLLPGPYKIVP